MLHRHEVLDRAADAHIAHFGLRADDVIYIPSPLAHQTGWLYGMWIAWRLGATQVIQESWDAEVGVRRDRPPRRHVHPGGDAVPRRPRARRRRARRDARRRNPLRMFVATGAAIPRELARRARDVLDAEVGGGFGTTESCMGAGFVPGLDDERAWTSDGVALANVSLRVVDDDGRELPPGTEGNFEIGTDTLFAGYLNRPAETAAAITADGWYRPGDLATIDADGYLRITGRVKDVINRGGEKVPVAEIEQLLYAHPAVAEVAIVAMPDERLGERACAFVVPRGRRTAASTSTAMQALSGRAAGRQAVLARAAGAGRRAAAHAVRQDPEVRAARTGAQVHRRAQKGDCPMTTVTATDPVPLSDDELAELTAEIRAYVETRASAGRSGSRPSAPSPTSCGPSCATAATCGWRRRSPTAAAGCRSPSTCRCWSCSRCRTRRCG